MNPQFVVSLLVAVPLVLLGVGTGWYHVRAARDLNARAHVPSDELAYLRGRNRRRLVVSCLMVVIGSLIIGAFASGMEGRADRMAEKLRPEGDGPKRELTPEQRDFLRMYGTYWLAVGGLTLALVGLAVVDAWATRKYWFGVYRTLRDEHNTRLRRDLAAYKAQRDTGRAGHDGYGGRLGSGGDDQED